MIQVPIDSSEIVITAARAPQQEEATAASATIIDGQRIERLGEPLLPALLRLVPSTAVATSGPAGSLTEVRIRGAEANHTLLFIEGIRVNDPASGNQPRFELLNADIASRVEVIRGPQSALWGSEAIGGVIAINGVDAEQSGLAAVSELGSRGFRRASASGSLRYGEVTASTAVGWQRSSGIDAFDGTGDRDGYRNLSGRLRGTWTPSPVLEIGLSALALTGRSQFDGYSPVTFLRTDTLDSSRNRLFAGRLWSRFGTAESRWSGQVAASVLGSANRNLLAGEEINRTAGGRWNFGAQIEHRMTTGPVRHRLIAALEQEDEAFRARDTVYGGISNQDRERRHRSVTAEWRMEAGPVVGDVAVRRDLFSGFKDATTVRLSALAAIGHGFSVAGSYGEGIAQPTFFDLYGFFPGNFAGNPSLRPESSRGFEVSLRYRTRRLEGALTWYRQRLTHEIVDLFDPVTFVASTANRASKSRRSGLEAEIGWVIADALRITGHYALLSATEPDLVGTAQLREVRRPRHSGAIGADGEHGRFSYGLSLAYTGRRTDTNFDLFPAQAVTLGSYWMGGARLGYAIAPRVDIFARVSNGFDQRYEDVFGNRTEGRSLHAGIRVSDRR